MKSAAQTDWRQKYFDSLGGLEAEQLRFRAIEATLRRLASRLCSAALGQSQQLDELLRQLQTALKKDAASDELEKFTASLTDAVRALDQRMTNPAVATAPPPAAAARGPLADDTAIRATLAAVLAELRRDEDLAQRADALDVRLTSSIPADALPGTLAEIAGLVGERIRRLEDAKQEIESVLADMVGKLDEIGTFVTAQHQSQNEAHASTQTLSTQLVVEMQAMGESVEATNDLRQIRTQVRSRLDSIDRHLQDFRQREAQIEAAMHSRTEHMRQRIAELESRATHLQRQLRVEQLLATIDTLTRVPNRLAYQKRMEEELSRWQRFRQPACLVVWDVDYFKRINDTYGHRAGDRVLRTVAECLAGRIRSTDFLARYGGEEFTMILSGTKLDDARRLVDEMREGIATIGFHFRGAPVGVTASAGFTDLRPGDSAESAFDRADKALYQAKQTGRNRCATL